MQDDDELVAAESGEQRPLSDRAADPLRHHREQPVTDAVAETVVDRFEIVEIDEQQRHRADGYAGEQVVDLREQLGAVGQPGEIIVGRRPAQLVGDPLLLGDVLDVRDRQRDTVVLGDRDTRPGPHVGPVAALIALVEQVGVGDPELETGPMDGGRLEVVGMGDLPDAAPDEVVSGALEHLGERAIGVDDRRVVEAHQGHARGCGVECLLEAPASLLQGAAPSFPIGDVDEPHDRPVCRSPRLVVRRFDDGDHTVEVDEAQRRAVDRRAPASFGEPGVEVRAVADLDELAQRRSGQRRCAQTGELGGLGVGTADEAGVVDRDDGLGEVVEQHA